MQIIELYRQQSGSCPVEDFLDSLNGKQAQKVAWVLDLVRTLPRPPKQYFKKLVGTELWEVRTEFGGNALGYLNSLMERTLSYLPAVLRKKTKDAKAGNRNSGTPHERLFFKERINSVWPEIPDTTEMQHLGLTIVGRMFADTDR